MNRFNTNLLRRKLGKKCSRFGSGKCLTLEKVTGLSSGLDKVLYRRRLALIISLRFSSGNILLMRWLAPNKGLTIIGLMFSSEYGFAQE